MVVQLGHILITAAVAQEAVTTFVEFEFLHQALHGCHQVDKEIGVGWFEAHHTADLTLWYNENVERVAGFGVVEGEQ